MPRMRAILIRLCLAGATSMAISTAQAEQPSFFQSMLLGRYICSPNLCQISDRQGIWLAESFDYEYTWFGLQDTTGHVEAISALGDGLYQVSVSWDDGSGKPIREQVQVKALDASSFIFTDSQGRRNRMDFVGDAE